MNTCYSCRFYDPTDGRVDEDGWGICLLATYPYHYPNKASLTRLDGELADALWLETAPSFGCNRHEPKDDPS